MLFGSTVPGSKHGLFSEKTSDIVAYVQVQGAAHAGSRTYVRPLLQLQFLLGLSLVPFLKTLSTRDPNQGTLTGGRIIIG